MCLDLLLKIGQKFIISRDAYNAGKGKVVANFNDRKIYGADAFPDELFPDNIFPDGSTAAQINAARTTVKIAAVNDANNNDIRTQRFFLETMLYLLVEFQRLMAF